MFSARRSNGTCRYEIAVEVSSSTRCSWTLTGYLSSSEGILTVLGEMRIEAWSRSEVSKETRCALDGLVLNSSLSQNEGHYVYSFRNLSPDVRG